MVLSTQLNTGNANIEEVYHHDIKAPWPKVLDFNFKHESATNRTLLPSLEHNFKIDMSNFNGIGFCIDEDISTGILARARQIFIKSIQFICHKDNDFLTYEGPLTQFMNYGNDRYRLDRYYWQHSNRSCNLSSGDIDIIRLTVNVLQFPVGRVGWNIPLHLTPYISPLTIARGRSETPCSKYLLNPELSDVTIVCGDTELPAHKFILCNNPVFEKMLQPQFQEGKENIIKIVDTDAGVMKMFLQFLYQRSYLEEEELKKNSMELLPVAHKYIADDLKRVCECSLADNLTVENIIETYHLSKVFKAEKLQAVCEIFFRINLKEIITDTDVLKQITNEYPDLMFSTIS